jgi:hypothetical protein
MSPQEVRSARSAGNRSTTGKSCPVLAHESLLDRKLLGKEAGAAGWLAGLAELSEPL